MAKDKGGNQNRKGGKTAAKKWGAQKAKDKIVNLHVINQGMYDRIIKDAPKMSLISISTFSDKFKVGGSIARKAFRELVTKELIVPVGDFHQSCPLYRGSQWSLKKEAEEKAEAGKKKKGGKKKD